jgi:preprotein translocase subunit SecA
MKGDMIAGLLARLFGTNNARQIKLLQPIVARINELEPRMRELTDEQLTLKTQQFREQLSQGKSLDDILPEAFALVRETSHRKLGQRHYDVQLMGGIVLHQGKIAEMKTGEGKTLTATLPLYLNALTGKSSHLVTVNDYLARRDAEWMSPIYQHLGLTVGTLQNSMHDHARKDAYQADILYGTNSELGFDYLRDNMKFRLSDYVQRGLNFAIVDEVDSILIDEARTPLIISGASDESSDLYGSVNRVVGALIKNIDYEVDEKEKRATLTELGNDKVEKALRVDNLYAIENVRLLHHTNQSLKAHALFKKDVEYVVRDGEVLIVDEFTGRILPGRRYSDGLHQAIEAKEGVTIEQETQTLASITLQNFFRLYSKLSGMTGTAATEAEEFYQIYKLNIVTIPTNVQVIRVDNPDLIFLTKNAKYNAIIEDVKKRYEVGQPVLIGTIAVETSELLSSIFSANRIPHEVLNAKNHAREAEIVAHAGEKGRITIATNMAGRGTDIKLTSETKTLGGLYILGTERHESRRIDNQLRGRSGRQGDAGESRFYISLEDDLIRIFAGDSIKKNMERFGMKEDEVVESRFISRNIESSQEKVEKYNFEVRKHLLEYDDVLNQQRTVVYDYRRETLEGEQQIFDLVRDLIATSVEDIIAARAPRRNFSQEAYEEIIKTTAQLSNLSVSDFENKGLSQTNADQLTSDLINLLLERYQLYTEGPHVEQLREAQKWLMLETIDTAWKQHMLNLDNLKEGIGLRQVGQKNPLIEYKRESFAMFEDMMRNVRWEIVHHIFHLDIERFDTRKIEKRREEELRDLHMIGGQESTIAGVTVATPPAVAKPEAGRNEACPCGSGKKYKKCCLRSS